MRPDRAIGGGGGAAGAAACACAALLLAACGGGYVPPGPLAPPTPPATPAPAVASAPSLNGAQVIRLSDSDSSAAIFYTLDGTAPTSSSTPYLAPFLLAAPATVTAIAIAPGRPASATASQKFAISIPSGTLVWAQDFGNATSANAQPDPSVWTYDTGGGGWGNQELETYCAWSSSNAPCDAANPNAYIGTDGVLHVVARQPAAGVYTSARLKTQGLFSFQYGRVEARMLLPEGQGLWPAFWLLGNNISAVGWPACGEQDVMEHINQPSPDWVAGSLHGTSANLSQKYFFPAGASAAGWHVYGMIWAPGKIEYYLDSPANIYATFTPASLAGQPGAVWPFDGGGAFLILNLAVGGNWPGAPNGATSFPAQALVSYIHIYTN